MDSMEHYTLFVAVASLFALAALNGFLRGFLQFLAAFFAGTLVLFPFYFVFGWNAVIVAFVAVGVIALIPGGARVYLSRLGTYTPPQPRKERPTTPGSRYDKRKSCNPKPRPTKVS